MVNVFLSWYFILPKFFLRGFGKERGFGPEPMGFRPSGFSGAKWAVEVQMERG